MNNRFIVSEEDEVKVGLAKFLVNPSLFFCNVLKADDGSQMSESYFLPFAILANLSLSNVKDALVLDSLLDFSFFDRVEKSYKNSHLIYLKGEKLTHEQRVQLSNEMMYDINQSLSVTLAVYIYFLYKNGLLTNKEPATVFTSLSKEIENQLMQGEKVNFAISKKGSWSRTEKKYVELCERVINQRAIYYKEKRKNQDF